jgi:nucleotide-binding universal stress UspA family protein
MSRYLAKRTRQEPVIDAGAVATLVVPTDGSTLSHAAARVGARLASRLDAGLALVSAVPTGDDVAPREQELADLYVDVPPGRVSRSVVVHPDPAAMIHEALDRIPHPVLVMATHGHGRSAAPAGSVAMAVIARGRHPVVVTCPLVEPRVGSGVLACVDQGPQAGLVVATARRWAELLGETVTVVTVAEPDRDAEAVLAAAAGPVRERGPRLEALAIHDPIGPSCGLHQRLREAPASLVVAGSRAGEGLARLVLGRVAGTLVRHSPSPVLLLPPRVAPWNGSWQCGSA